MSDKPHLHVEFYTDAIENKRKSIDAGRPIFEDVEMVRVKIAGDPKNTFVSPANAECGRDRETGDIITYKDRFPEHYRFFADHKGAAVIGTPLAEVSWLTASKVQELKALNIMTVEALAQLDGSNLQRLGMGGRELKNQATAWLDKAEGSKAQAHFAAELSARDEIIAQLQRDMAALQAGQPVAPVDEPEAEADEGMGEDSPFWAWDDEDIKNWLKDNSGSRPAGNPKHATLVAKADALNAELSAKKAA